MAARSATKARVSGSTKAFTWTYYSTAQMHLQTQTIINSPTHPLKYLMEKRWQDRDKTKLWTYLYSVQRVSKKGFIRRTHNKRIKHAILDALREVGLDRLGQAITIEPKDGHLPATSISGSLSIWAQQAILTTEYKDLLDCARQMLGRIRGSASSSAARGRPQWKSLQKSGAQQDHLTHNYKKNLEAETTLARLSGKVS